MDILSIIGIAISIIGVLASLLLFCASVNNSRKILINKVLYTITYEILWMFSDSPFSGDDKQKLEKREKFNRTLFALHRSLQEISYSSDIGIPYLDFCKQEKTDNAWRSVYNLDKTFIALDDYFKKRHFIGLKLMLEAYDDRLLLFQNYHQERKYIRKMFIGPIIGVRLQYVRSREKVCYIGKGQETHLIRRVKSIKDYKKYYDKCYLKFDFGKNVTEKKPFERNIKDIVIETKEQIPITLYR